MDTHVPLGLHPSYDLVLKKSSESPDLKESSECPELKEPIESPELEESTDSHELKESSGSRSSKYESSESPEPEDILWDEINPDLDAFRTIISNHFVSPNIHSNQ